MKIVVDVNVVLSSLLGKGDSLKVFEFNSIFNKFDFIAPEFLMEELNKHKKAFSERTKLPEEEFDEIFEFVLEQITFVSKSEFSEHFSKAKEILSEHLKDVQYLALALKLNCSIFSGDKILKSLLSKTPIEVLSPKEILSKF
ncbi:MAG: PIN domain-containing protein [Candidatus Pacearchaeota archaeon]